MTAGRSVRVHILQHVPFEGPGAIREWAKRAGHEITMTHFYKEDRSLPAPQEVGLLVVMGGPMGVHDEAQYPWLAEEKRFVRAAIDAGVRVLGVCLGAQLVALVLGAAVTRNAQKEIGWFPVSKVQPHPWLETWPESLAVFHWHGDTFAIPEGAVRLLDSEACPQQAFVWGGQVLGLQFHLEMGPDDVRALVQEAYADLQPPGLYVQDADTIVGRTAPYEILQRQLFLLLENLLDNERI